MSEQVPELKIDKSAWGEGPWQTEPDRIDWIHAGYACMMLRHPDWGNWCGYVGIDRAHPFYGEKPFDLPLEAHVGVNYGAKCREFICHVPAPGMPADVWWLGFDCGHTFDFAPGRAAFECEVNKRIPALGVLAEREEELNRLHPFLRGEYRPLDYVKHVTERLAEQLRAKA